MIRSTHAPTVTVVCGANKPANSQGSNITAVLLVGTGQYQVNLPMWPIADVTMGIPAKCAELLSERQRLGIWAPRTSPSNLRSDGVAA